MIWSAIKPGPITDLLQFAFVLQCAAGLMRSRDTTLTLEQFLNRLPLMSSFKQRFMYPFLLSGWCVEPDEYRRFLSNVPGFGHLSENKPAFLGEDPKAAIMRTLEENDDL